jgi:hypothetical protein
MVQGAECGYSAATRALSMVVRNGRILISLTRRHGGGPALQFEVELRPLISSISFAAEASVHPRPHNWMRDFSKILTAPPCVEILRAEELKVAYSFCRKLPEATARRR